MSYKKNLISVIIPIYNVEKYLARCLDSILDNSYKDLEIICINDGSTDNCLEILKKYRAQDPRIIIINKTNAGQSSARNSGLKRAAGEYVAFIDSDDWVHAKYFEYLLKAIIEHKADMSMCAYVRTKDDIALKVAHYKSFPITRKKFLGDSKYSYYIWRRLFRHAIIKDLFFDEHIKIEDIDYLARLMIKRPNISIAYVNSALYAYYIREGSLSSLLSADSTLELSNKIIRYIGMTESKEIKSILAEAAIKRMLSARLAYIALNDKKKISKCNSGIKKSLPYAFSFKYLLLALFPAIYAFYRIKDDPTMRIYLKRLRKNRI